MDYVAFYVITQGPFYKNGIGQINLGNIFLIFAICAFCWYNLLPNSQQPRNEKNKAASGQSTLLFWWQYYQIDENASSCWMDR
jgi:hypothetical protein